MAEAATETFTQLGIGPALNPQEGQLIEVIGTGTFTMSGDIMTFAAIKAASGAIKHLLATGRAAAATVISISNNVVTVTVTGGTIVTILVVGTPA